MKEHLLSYIFVCFLFIHPVISQVSTTGNTVFQSSVVDNSGYDVVKYKLEFSSHLPLYIFSGKTTVYFKALTELNQIVLDAGNNLTINNVMFKGQVISDYSRANNKIIINLPEALPVNSNGEVSVSFSGNSQESTGYKVNSDTDDRGAPFTIAYTFSERLDLPASWWVCKDGLTDKADEIELHITHPSACKAVSNGLPVSITDNHNGTSTTVWRHKYPIATYLVALAVAEYEEYHQTVRVGETEMPILNFLSPMSRRTSYILEDLDKIPYCIQYFSELFGDYPFKEEKYGHAEWYHSGAMEHSTISFISRLSFNESVLVHELAHHWFGDNVTCATWNDIWINEGFATFAEDLWWEHYNFDFLKGSPYAAFNETIAHGSVYNPEPENDARTFDSDLTYFKSGLVFHQLRNKLGDDVFFKAIQEFLEEKRFCFVTTEDIKQSFSKTSGIDLTEFFNDWVYGKGYPVFDFTLNQNRISDVTLKVDQTQSDPSISFFETPFKIEFKGYNNESVIKEFDLTSNHQVFQITDIPFAIKDMLFNPFGELLALQHSTILGIDSPEADYSLKVHFDPGNDCLNLSSKENMKEIRILDVPGRLLGAFKPNQTESIVDASGWNKGVYIIRVTFEGGSITRKVSVY